MVAYEFYWRDSRKKFHLIGILPERRKSTERITEDSIMRWVKIILGENLKLTDLFFSQVIINQETGEVSHPRPPFTTEAEA